MRFLRVRWLAAGFLCLGSMSVQAQSPAQRFFDEAAYFLSLSYGGFAEPGPRELLPEYRETLREACEKEGERCPADEGVTVVEALLEALGDAHTGLYAPEAFEEVQRFLGGEGEAPSFGLLVRALEGKGLVVLEVIAGSPAEEAGLGRGDLIVRLDDLPLDEAEASPALLWDLEASGEPVRLGVLREGREGLELELRSEALPRLRLPELASLEDDIALLRVPSFVPALEVGARIHALATEAEAAGAQGLVIDLRDNPGGFISDCLAGAGAFVDAPMRLMRSSLFSQTLRYQAGRVYSRSGEGREFAQTVTDSPARFRGPVVVLVNAYSASCAEFFALDLQWAGAPVVGEATAGVANTLVGFVRLSDGWGLQITAAGAFDAAGRAYPEHVTPDVAQDNDLLALSRGGDLVLEAGLERLRELMAARRH